jgi:hypothetical protein
MKYGLLTTTSPLKMNAVKKIFPEYEWVGIKTETGCEQPYGKNQINHYNQRRIDDLLEFTGKKPLYDETPIISIESGICCVQKNYCAASGLVFDLNYYDTAQIVFIKGKSKIAVGAECVHIPQEFNDDLAEATRRGLNKVTFGQILQEKYGYNAKDWFKDVNCANTSRTEQLVKTLQEIRGYIN